MYGFGKNLDVKRGDGYQIEKLNQIEVLNTI